MATLEIGGEAREVRFTANDLDLAEREIVKRGGRVITDVLGNHNALFSKFELEWLLWGAWRTKVSTKQLNELIAQFYAEGGTIYDLQAVVAEAMIDTGLYGKRRVLVDDATPVDPQPAGTSG